MKLQFKEQQFQIDAVKAVVDCFDGQPLKTNRFTLERSKEIIRKAKQVAIGDTISAFGWKGIKYVNRIRGLSTKRSYFSKRR